MKTPATDYIIRVTTFALYEQLSQIFALYEPLLEIFAPIVADETMTKHHISPYIELFGEIIH